MKNHRKSRKWIILTLIMAAALITAWKTGMFYYSAAHYKADASVDWNLILVNRFNHIPDDYEVKLLTLSNGEQVDERIYPELQSMFDNARSEGLQLFVRAGYRTWDQQQTLLDRRIAEFREAGYSEQKAARLAREWVAEPGTSEHQLGLAVDINADTSVTSSDMVYSWLDMNACHYGFIRRYPPDKAEITGVSDEQWHYRYVGTAAAMEMDAQNLCLEEYLDAAASREGFLMQLLDFWG